jgi:hypothetical protein
MMKSILGPRRSAVNLRAEFMIVVGAIVSQNLPIAVWPTDAIRTVQSF